VNIRGPLASNSFTSNTIRTGIPSPTAVTASSSAIRTPVGSQPQDPSNPLSHSRNWQPSNLNGGAGAADPGINPESVVINEAMSSSTAPSGDWIELQELTNAGIDVSGWYLSNDA
jgi:hypothetical protein